MKRLIWVIRHLEEYYRKWVKLHFTNRYIDRNRTLLRTFWLSDMLFESPYLWWSSVQWFDFWLSRSCPRGIEGVTKVMTPFQFPGACPPNKRHHIPRDKEAREQSISSSIEQIHISRP
jgi:hypothetical protein